ncbi:MAG: tripartite tricarboxylate transporter permease [Xanthobacteraceae bacterium]
MDVLTGLMQGFAHLLEPAVTAACVIGLLVGIVAGFLPGMSPLGGLALAFSFVGAVFSALGPNSPVVFLMAAAYGTLYGRALAAMNLSAPVSGSAGAHPDRSGMVAGLFAGIFVAAMTAVIAVYARLHVTIALGPVELAAVITFLLLGAVSFGCGSAASALAMTVLGLLLGVVGDDLETGAHRLTFGIAALEDGIGMLDAAIGLFVIANIFHDLGAAATDRPLAAAAAENPVRGVVRGTILGVLAGFLPTNGTVVTTTVAERRRRPTEDPFDPASQTDAHGIVAAAMASDVRFSVSLIPLLAWFIPCDVVSALLRRVISVQEVLTNQAARDRMETVWLVCVALVSIHVVPCVMILLPGFARRIIRVDIRIIAPLVIAGCCIAIFLVTPNLIDFAVMFAFGLVGYYMILADFDRSVLFFAFLFASTFEENIRRSLLIARGDAMIFLERPISAGFLIAGVLLLITVRAWRHNRRIEVVGEGAVR